MARGLSTISAAIYQPRSPWGYKAGAGGRPFETQTKKTSSAHHSKAEYSPVSPAPEERTRIAWLRLSTHFRIHRSVFVVDGRHEERSPAPQESEGKRLGINVVRCTSWNMVQPRALHEIRHALDATLLAARLTRIRFKATYCCRRPGFKTHTQTIQCIARFYAGLCVLSHAQGTVRVEARQNGRVGVRYLGLIGHPIG